MAAVTGTFWQRGDALDYTNSSGSTIEANTIILYGARIGIAGTEIASGDTGGLIVTGVFEMPKASATAITAGAEVYWDDTNKNITTTSSGNTKAGFAVAAAASADATVLVKINA